MTGDAAGTNLGEFNREMSVQYQAQCLGQM